MNATSFLHGATLDAKGECHFCVFAPFAQKVTIEMEGAQIKLSPRARGYFEGSAKISDGTRYKIRLDDNTPLPDPASRSQPDGVHGASQIRNLNYAWRDADFKGATLEGLIVYEMHVGTFSAEGTFAGAIADLPRLKQLGVTAIQVMPIAQFPGERNWGYDGVYPFAVQHSYGGPNAFLQFVDAAHQEGLAVILDVVYNHLGPEGNYFAHFGPYFNDAYKTPWGAAINFDDAYASEVRAFYLQNARQWFEVFHVDGLRLDAVHAIHDETAMPFLEELVALKKELELQLDKSLLLIAESDRNDSRLLTQIGIDAHYNDDVHHVIHALITGERTGYYEDYGRREDLVKYLYTGVVYDGQYSAHRRRSHGRSYDGVDKKRLLIFAQNHDQIGNRPLGERLTSLVDERKARLATALYFLSPFTPALFMGEEYGERAPFLYFADHSDPQIIKATREGREREWGQLMNQPLPDPFAVDTFARCKLRRKKTALEDEYRDLIALSQQLHRQGLWEPGSYMAELLCNGDVLSVKLRSATLLFNLSAREHTVKGHTLSPYAFFVGP